MGFLHAQGHQGSGDAAGPLSAEEKKSQNKQKGRRNADPNPNFIFHRHNKDGS
jgi:hypothetical protein